MPDIDAWKTTWRGLLVDECNDELYREIVTHYSESHRSYHTLQHLNECFARLGEGKELAERLHEVELALWFHDAVYDVRGQDNEERSASWAEVVARDAGLPASVVGRVRALILATKHNVVPSTPDEKLLVDVDLAILGAPVERFDEYERQVRQEYSWVPSFLFRSKRREILSTFLSRPRIFSTDYFWATYEAQARANLARSIKILGG